MNVVVRLVWNRQTELINGRPKKSGPVPNHSQETRGTNRFGQLAYCLELILVTVGLLCIVGYLTFHEIDLTFSEEIKSELQFSNLHVTRDLLR